MLILVGVVIVIGIGAAVAGEGKTAEQIKAETAKMEAELELQNAIDAAGGPVTDRQLNFIDSLILERQTEAWMLETDPETVQEASELIDGLLKMPRWEEDQP